MYESKGNYSEHVQEILNMVTLITRLDLWINGSALGNVGDMEKWK